LLVGITHSGDEQAHPIFGRLPKYFDPPFTPQHIDPELATIALSPGFEKGRYDIRISLSETTLSGDRQEFARNYRGEFILQCIQLPTDDFQRLSGKEFKNAADKLSNATIEFTQVARQGEKIQRPLGQQYPVVLQSIHFGPVHRHILYAELFFQVDFSAAGPPTPWTQMASMNPYQIARMNGDFAGAGYSKEEWDSFSALVKETESLWSKARYSTNVRVLLNHLYEPSSNMNTHER